MMNWSDPNWGPIYLMILKIKKSQNFSDHSEIFFLLYNTLKTEQKLFLGKNFFVPEKKIVSLKKTLKKNFVSVTQRGGFQFIVILTP